MFGYIRPDKPEMLVREYEQYKSIYCALCKRLGTEYGVLSKLILSYDCTFLALMSKAIEGGGFCFERKMCRANPLKKCNFCTGMDSHLSMAAGFSVISYFYKLEDNIADNKSFKKALYRTLRFFSKRIHKKAALKYPYLESIVSEMMKQQKAAEQSANPSLDLCAEPTAIMLSKLMQTLAKTDASSKIYSDFGYFLGRWVYLTDAADDMADDEKKSGLNPFVSKFINTDLSKKEQYEECNKSLNACTARIIAAYELIDIKIFKGITDNIIHNGLAAMQKTIVTKDRSKKRKEKV